MPKDMYLKKDVSNVDLISDAIIRLMFCSHIENQVHHVINPEQVDINHIISLIKKRNENLLMMNSDELCEFYDNNFSNEKIRDGIANILIYCDILGEMRKNRLTVACEKTVAFLDQTGFKWNTFSDCVFEKAMDYMMKTGFIQEKLDSSQ